jgi:riboflavin kinase/FMN adenylyltransferase
MKIFRDIENISFKEPVIASIGGFDGIHLGHQKIIHNIAKKAKKKGVKSAIITFNPLPKIYFSNKNFEVISIYEKINFLRKFDIDYLIILRFNKNLISMSAQDFIEEILIKKLNIKSLTVGDDFKFGKNQSGNIEDLENYASKGFFNLNIENKQCIENTRISSTLIRDAVASNDFALASKMLGRSYSISGKIIHGEKRGSKIGFPTANIKLKANILLSGVYAVSTYFDNKEYYGVANIGYKPTFDGNTYLFEAHIFDLSKNLYGRRLEFHIISKIRETKKFKGIEELKDNIDNDINSAKKIFKIK